MNTVEPASPAYPADRDTVHHSVQSPDSVGMLALRLLGDLQPQVSGQGRSILVAAADDDAAGLEATLELAWCLAQDLGHSVLLVDGAFGDRSMSTALDLAEQPGLAEFLDATENVDTVLQGLEQSTAHPRIAVLPQGRPGGARTIRPQRLQALFVQACQRHEFVLVRSSLHADVNRSLAFSTLVDAALLVAVEEQTTWDQISRGQRVLNDCGARRVALVLASRPRAPRPGRR